MGFELLQFVSGIIQKQAVNEIVECNDITRQFGLELTAEQALELVETRLFALNSNGRIAFGGGAVNKIIMEFCDSPYISMYNYNQTLHDLVEIFYYYKNHTMDLISDDDLIKFMKKSFDGVWQGSLELLSGRELYLLAQNLRYGRPDDYSENEESFEDDGEQY